MKNENLYLREYGEIHKTDENKTTDNIDKIYLNAKAWNYLAQYAESSEKDNRFLKFKNTTTLKVQNFVGVITTPDGTQIEILPKINETANEKSASESRTILEKMLKVVNNLPFIQTTKADLQLRDEPLPEMLINWFLEYVKNIVKQGIRRDYNRIKAQEPFLKGQLQTAKQFNEPPHKQHLFHIEYDIFSPNRPENSLIHSALLQVLKWSKDNQNQKQIKHFLLLFDGVPLSENYKNDFEKWSKNRAMNYYQPVLPWLKLILNQQSPFTLKDKNAGISFLLPMEKLFEKYVAKILTKQLPNGYQLKEQIASKYLCKDLSNDLEVFQLKPDIAIYKGAAKLENLIYILDTKWKLIDERKKYNNSNDDKKKNISQSDMYQLFAYGKKYQVKKVALIYPKWEHFNHYLNFQFDDNLGLNVLSFDLEEDSI